MTIYGRDPGTVGVKIVAGQFRQVEGRSPPVEFVETVGVAGTDGVRRA